MEILCFDFEILWMSSQLIVQWNYIIYFYIWGSFFNNFLHQFLEKNAKFKRSCKSAKFVYFDLWLRRYQNICTLPKYYYSIERVYFNCRLLILFISTFSLLLFLYRVTWKYKRDYLHASVDVLFYIMFYIINMIKDIGLFYTAFMPTIKKFQFESARPSILFGLVKNARLHWGSSRKKDLCM